MKDSLSKEGKTLIMKHTRTSLALDMHVHVDEHVNYQLIPTILRARGLDGAGLLTHNDLPFAMKVAKMLQAIDKQKIYLPGVELDTSQGHLVVFGIDKAIPPELSPEETIELAKDLGGISIIPHPFMSHNSLGWKVQELKANAIEFLNGFAKVFLNIPNIMTKIAFRNNGFSEVGGSDAHYAFAIGSCYSLIETYGSTKRAAVLEAISNQRVIPRKKPLDHYDLMNFFRIVFGEKRHGRKIIRI
ncbi:MAG: hypothetical protein GF308_04440 [Candidatus Heimdallarchaeota archaeon]|nr:hypothetical protein [Candidatus Heimdallarchaeota archaeon]